MSIADKIKTALGIVKQNPDTERYYLETGSEYEELREIIHSYEIKLDDYQLKWLDEAFNDLLYMVDEEILTTLDIADFEFDIEADCYTSDLTEWLDSDNERVYYLTEVLETYELKDGFELLRYAQYIEKDEVYNNARYILIKYFE